MIVGAGAAGCVLADRLSRNPAMRVLLIECGPPDNHPLIHMPKGIGRLRNDPRYTWSFDVYRQPGDDVPAQQWMRGRTLGGSTSINGMLYTRGQPEDYEQFAALTSAEWNWAHMAEAFRAVEGHDLGPRPTRGAAGPLRVSAYPGDGGDDTLMRAVLEAGKALGLDVQDDINEPDDRAKIGYTPRTIHRGRRQSAAVAFLRSAERRPNVTVRTGLLADRVLFEGARAVAVEASDNGRPVRFHGRRIILSAGTLSSPAILERSGIGDPALLARYGVPLVAARPAVGEHLIEHTIINTQWRAKGGSNNARYRGLGSILSGIRYYLTRSGPLANAVLEITGAIRTTDDSPRPNAQISFGPHSFADSAQKTRTPEREHGFMFCTHPLRPRSQGSVHVVSRDATVNPKVVYDPFADPNDRREMIDAVRYARRLAATEPLASFALEETRPGPQAETDDEILDALRRLSGPGFHAVGTCRMGHDDHAVVDPFTRVRGTDGLHVVDLSVFPLLTAGNTYGPVAALAWRASDLIERLDDNAAGA